MSSKFLVDTNIIIGYLNDNSYFNYVQNSKNMFISAISIMELYALGGTGKPEEEKIRDTLDLINIASIAQRAGYFARTRPNRNNRSDLLIAATAIELDIPLMTRNVRDFKGIPEIKLVPV